MRRAGYLITPTLMLYGTGGFAYGKTSVSDNISVSSNNGPGGAGSNQYLEDKAWLDSGRRRRGCSVRLEKLDLET